MRTRTSAFAIALVACFAVTFHAGAGKGGGKPQPEYLARSDFRDAPGDAIQSDGTKTFTCDGANGAKYDYIDNHDECDPDDVATASRLLSGVTYFLRAFPGDLTGEPPPEPRWMVLDFWADSRNRELECPDLDVKLWDPAVGVPPVNSDTGTCVDNVAVRFFAEKAFQAGAQSSTVYLLIDGPVQVQWGLQWNAKYMLEFWNPLSVSRPLGTTDTIVIGGATGDDFRADLWTLKKGGAKGTRIGTFHMPFQATVKKTNQIFSP